MKPHGDIILARSSGICGSRLQVLTLGIFITRVFSQPHLIPILPSNSSTFLPARIFTGLSHCHACSRGILGTVCSSPDHSAPVLLTVLPSVSTPFGGSLVDHAEEPKLYPEEDEKHSKGLGVEVRLSGCSSEVVLPETLAFFALPLSPTPDEGNARSPSLLCSCPKHTEEVGTLYRETALDIHRLHFVILVLLQSYRKPKPSHGEVGKAKPWPKARCLPK
ncbi:uncharacterized protein LOC125109447 [Lutra lutra]|uniref:uncharacterized protein LOC125109447 n=1 Tax=Lutra lutra TaxID=9657 RepID=UPI001FD28E62|nr:uncharacterized protein LOC125109447 [Lutra lutra]